MNITAQMVKELRDKTGAGMMDAKKALVETDGDMEKAMEVLRQKGMASADKKMMTGRIGICNQRSCLLQRILLSFLNFFYNLDAFGKDFIIHFRMPPYSVFFHAVSIISQKKQKQKMSFRRSLFPIIYICHS